MDEEDLVFYLSESWSGDDEAVQCIARHFSARSPYFMHDEKLWSSLIISFRKNIIISDVLKESLKEHKDKYKNIHWGPDTKNLCCLIADEETKTELINSYKGELGSKEKYWICSTLMEAWPHDREVVGLFKEEFTKPANEVAHLADWVDILLNDDQSRREWLLSSITKPEQGLAISPPVTQLFERCSDDECIEAVKKLLSEDIWHYHKLSIKSKLIEIASNDEDVNKWVAEGQFESDGTDLASIAVGCKEDRDVRSKLLDAACPAKSAVKSEIYRIFREHSIPSDIIINLTETVWTETDGAIRTSGVVARCFAVKSEAEHYAKTLTKLEAELEALGTGYEERRRSAFTGLLSLGEYDICAKSICADEMSTHWLAGYHNGDAVSARILLTSLEELTVSLETAGSDLAIPWAAMISNGTAREAYTSGGSRKLLIDYLKNETSTDETLEKVNLMAELIPSAPVLRERLLELIRARPESIRGLEAQRIYAQQFQGDESALSELKAIFPKRSTSSDPSGYIPPYLYGLLVGWREDSELREILKRDTLPSMPLIVALEIGCLEEDEEIVREVLELIIKAAIENKFSYPQLYIHSLKRWVSERFLESFLRGLLIDTDCSHMIAGVRLLHMTGKLNEQERIDLVNILNELLSEPTLYSPDGVDLASGEITTLPQVLIRTLLFGDVAQN